MPYRRCRAQRPEAAGGLAGLLAQLRRRHPDPAPARHPASRLRPGRHPLRPGQQLRPALRHGRDQRRPDPRRGLRPLPRRAGHLDQGRLGHVARPLRRPRARASTCSARLDQIADAPAPGLRRHLLPPPLRPRHAAGGDDGRAGPRGAPGQGALRRDLVVLRAPAPAGRGDPARPRHAAADPPAVLLDAQPLGRGRPARRPRATRAWAASASPPWPRACSPSRYLGGIPEDSRDGPGQEPVRGPAHARRTSGTSAR